MSAQMKRGSKYQKNDKKYKFEGKKSEPSSQGTPDKGPSPQEKLKEMINISLAYLMTDKEDLELEVRFGTKNIKYITKQDYDNVIQKLLSLDFRMDGPGDYILRCFGEYTDPQTGVVKQSNIRTEINGLANIKKFCETNSIDEFQYEYDIKCVQKSNFRLMPNKKRENMGIDIEEKEEEKKEETKTYLPVEFNDFNFRVALNREYLLRSESVQVNEIMKSWTDTKKIYRLINRVSFIHRDMSVNPFKIDLSVVRESHKRPGRYNMIPEYNIKDAEVFEANPKYEIEIEMINNAVYDMTAEKVESELKKTIKYVLCGLQQTNYPVSYIEQNSIMKHYLKLVRGDDYDEQRMQNYRVKTRDFIGPSSYTLQLKNVAPINPDSNIPNIRNNYTVTDKADGERKLLYINDKGKIYLIDINMNVQFTGSVTEPFLGNTILDGEHILHDKNKLFINLYAAFDIYFLNNSDKRALGFVPMTDEERQNPDKYRLTILNGVIQNLNPQSIVPTEKISPLRIQIKRFGIANEEKSIFQETGIILQQQKNGLFEYNTDGVIFTPMDKGVGLDKIGGIPLNYKVTWDYSFKWKPPHLNTIDFLVNTKKTTSGQDSISNVFNSGINVNSSKQIDQYKTLILCVGYDITKHGYDNPCNNVYEDNVPNPEDPDNEDRYVPRQFIPRDPYDMEAGICNVMLQEDRRGILSLMTEEGEVFSDETIVEFAYDKSKDQKWRWRPLRVRYDKTARFKTGEKEYGNAFHVANNNWSTIHNEVTETMISTGENIPDMEVDDEVYYNRATGRTKTRALRDFHNLYVKSLLIKNVSRRGDTLIDLAVGKGGDLPKWIASKLSFVFGVDVARDNIENKLDGVCARYLNYRREFKVMPSGLFVYGDSTVNIRNTDAMYTAKGKEITRAVFGMGPKDEVLLGKGVFKQYGRGSEGFDVSSIQFSIHYMFENNEKVQNLFRNLSECTKINGYFINTTFDGETVFRMLEDKKQGEKIAIYEDETKIWEISKLYDYSTFPNDVNSLGYGINVYQESINKVFKEYLVNFTYFTRLMENYGFVLITRNEARRLGFPDATGMFNELYTMMEKEIERYPAKREEYGTAMKMTAGERRISFLNRYMIFKKVRNVDAQSVAIGLLNSSIREEEVEKKESEKATSLANSVIKVKKTRKLKEKLKLV